MQRISCTISDKAEQALNEMINVTKKRIKISRSAIVEAGIWEIYERFKQNEKNNSNNGSNINGFGIL